jgi:diguanylate cyclase (GGDEF)-like protein
MIDIDRFKLINDRYGHIAGDAVIQGVAAALRDNMRPQDLICRFGGEEFVIFLHEHKRDDGYVVAERLRTAIAATLIPFEGGNLSVTVSIGGSLKDRLASIIGAIKDADEALYRAKKMGRNRTIFTPDTTAVRISAD